MSASKVFEIPQKFTKEPTSSGGSKLIVVEGAIGVGKTSMARMLGNCWKAPVLYETYEENPFLTGGFYENASEFAFNTEFFFLLSRFRQHRCLGENANVAVSDYLFEKNLI